MLVIRNIDKVYPINAMQVEIISIGTESSFYKFKFTHESYDSDLEYILYRYGFDKNKFEGNLIVDGGNPNRYDLDTKHLADPFKLISFLNEIVYDYDIITNK